MEVLIFIIGASVGSFLNVLIDRLPNNKSITGRSHCDYCKKKLAWFDLIPVFSFLFLKGRCRYCKKKLSFQYPLIEILTGLIFFFIFNFQFKIFIEFSIFNFQFLKLIILLGIVSCLIVIFVSDLKYHLISDYILIACGVFSALFHLTNSNQFQLILTTFLPSGLIVALPIFLIYFISHERAMGLGDVYLAAIIGFLLGWKEGFLAIYIAFITGAIIGLILIFLNKKKIKSKIAFGPFIVIGTVVMLFYGDKVFGMIRKIYGL